MKSKNAQEELFKSIKNGIKNARYEEINLQSIDIDLTVDIRVDRESEKDSQSVMQSVKNGYFTEISMLLVMEVKDISKYPIKKGKSFVVIDGKTRYLELFKINPNDTVFACVVPELDEAEQIYLNAIINSKRANLSDYARMVTVQKLIDRGFTIEQISETLGFSTKDIEQKKEIAKYPEQVKKMFEEGKISSRKLEEGIGFVYSNPKIVEITKTTEGKDYVDKCIIAQAEKIVDLSLKRDTMSTDKFDEKLQKHILIGNKNNISPVDVADASIPTVNGVYSPTSTDLICEHPSKIDVIEKYIKSNTPEFLVNLFCDPIIFNGKDYANVKSIIERGVEILGADKCTGVSHFETKHKIDFMLSLGIDVIRDGTKSDVYSWLSKQTVKHGKGLIVVDSYGSSKFNSKTFISYLKEKYPESTILFLMLDQFNNYRNCGEAFVPTYTIMNWGIDPVSSVPELAEKLGFEVVWNDTVEVNETEDGNLDNVTVDGRKKKRGIYLLKAE
jgi:hypothetical protein